MLGLERGESVGADTYAAVAEALGWSLDRIYAILSNEPVAEPSQEPTGLAAVSHEELAAELLRRMKAGDGDVGRDAAPMNVTKMPSRDLSGMAKKVARDPEKKR